MPKSRRSNQRNRKRGCRNSTSKYSIMCCVHIAFDSVAHNCSRAQSAYDPSSATPPTRGVDCNRDAQARLDAAHGWTFGASTLSTKATLSPRLSPFRSFGGLGRVIES